MIMMEGSKYGSIPLTNGSGSRRPKNTRIRRIRIRIRNTDYNAHRDRAQVLIINSKKTYFFAEPKLRFDARLARDESRSPVIT
jgi:hypothetical protein